MSQDLTFESLKKSFDNAARQYREDMDKLIEEQLFHRMPISYDTLTASTESWWHNTGANIASFNPVQVIVNEEVTDVEFD